MSRRLIVVLLVALGALCVAPFAEANTTDIIEPQNNPGNEGDGWQSSNCIADAPCSPSTPGQIFKVAGGHPAIGFTQYIIQHEPFTPLPSPPFPPGAVDAKIKPPIEKRTIKTLRVELPAGLTVNPLATSERCTLAEFENVEAGRVVPLCKPSTIVGREEVTLSTVAPSPPFPLPEGFVLPPSEANPLEPGEEPFTKVPVYALVPNQGEPALNGFVVNKAQKVFLKTDVSWQSDYHENFNISLPDQGESPVATLISRQTSIGTAGNGTYISNPTTCFNPAEAQYKQAYSTFFRAESYEEPDPNFPAGSTPVEAALPAGVKQEGCDTVPFDPSIGTAPGTTSVDSPAPATVETKLPFITGAEKQEESHLRNAKLTLPAGMGLNPSGSVGLEACTNAQFGKGTRNPVTCPAGSKIGSVEIETPPLPAGSLKGDIFLGQQLSSNPTSGEEFRIFIDAESARYGISTRLIGNTKANPTTGQLTTEITENPQVPFTSVKLSFDGAKSVLTSPPTCSNAVTTSSFEPWSTPASTKSPSASLSPALSTVPGGGACPTTLAARKFAPAYTAATKSPKAGAYSPLDVHIARTDGQQELKAVNVTLPKGLTGKLAGIPYCPESGLAAAAASTGRAQLANSSCPAASQIGVTTTDSGTGPSPARLSGKAFLTGPYKGAPLSMAVITPAVSGPFDLGTVVVRIAMNVNPETAQINAVSDTIPDVYGGVKLDIRTIDVNLNREAFTLNATNCEPQTSSGTLSGGGADPSNPAAFSSYAFSSPYMATECNKLGFQPKLFTRLFGNQTKRTGHPRIRAILEARKGDANIARTALTLPHAIFLDQSHIRTICTRPQLASQTCPKAAVYGHAEATTPLLENKLKGPVYLVSSSHTLPDLVADLRGQVNVQLHGIISSKRGGIKTVFNPVPDVAVSKFILNMEGGSKSLLVNSQDLCKKKLSSVLNIKGQNDKQVKNNKLPLKVSACSNKKKKK